MKAIFMIVTVFLISVILTGLIRRYALIKNILDIPNDRSSHHAPTPRGGGLSFVLLFSCIIAWLAFRGIIQLPLFYALSGGILVALIGWFDDVKSLRALTRAAIQGLTGIWAIYWLGGMPSLVHGTLGYIIGVISIIWCINLYNFMDGIDGLAGAEGVFISLSAGILLALIGVSGISLLCFLLTASIGGFLVWNWPPAKIFMGDVGSGYLGYIFCVLAIATANAKTLSLIFWCVIPAVFLFDSTFTVIKRKLEGKRWYEAHREHAYQCLTGFGWSHKLVTVSVSLLNFLVLLPVAYVSFYYAQWNNLIISVGVPVFFLLWISIVNNPFLKRATSGL